MSDHSQGPGWWQASDDKWYPPDQVPGPEAPDDPTLLAGPAPWGPPPSPGYGPVGFGTPGYAPVGGFAPAGASSFRPSVQGMATAAMVLGIVALVLFWCWVLAVLPALAGLVLGLVALSRINGGSAAPDGRGLALAGVICSGIALALTLFVSVAFALL